MSRPFTAPTPEAPRGAWRGEIRDVLPTVRGRIVAERGGGRTAGPVDPPGNIDFAAQHRGAELLDRLGQRGGGGPMAVAGEEREAEEKREDGSHQAASAAPPSRPSTSRR